MNQEEKAERKERKAEQVELEIKLYLLHKYTASATNAVMTTTAATGMIINVRFNSCPSLGSSPFLAPAFTLRPFLSPLSKII